MVDPTVHTTGINWDSVIVITGIVVTTLSIVFAFIAKWVANQITNAINKFRIQVVNELDTRLTRAEVKLTELHAMVARRRLT